MIQKMENQLLPQKSLLAIWQSPSRTSWQTGIILVLLCGLGLLLLLLIQRTPSSPPCKTRRVIRKGQVQMRRRTRSKTKSKNLKVYRNCLENLKEAQSIISLLKSYMGKLHDDSISHLSHWHLPGDECKPAPAGNKQPYQETEEDVSPDTLFPLASLAPPSQSPPPLAPFLPEEPQEVQSDMKRIPAGPVPENSPPRNSYLASLGMAIPGFDRLSSSISLFFWWWPTAKALLLLTSPHGRCQQEHLSYHPPEASLWGDATHRQVEAGGPSFISPAVQELLEMSISKRVELMLKAEEKTGSLRNQRCPSYILRSLGTLLWSLSNKQAATMPQPFWNLGNKPTQLPDPQHLSYSEVFGDDLEQKYSQLFWGLPSLHSESLVATAWVSNKKPISRTPIVRFNTNVTTQTQSADAPQVSQTQPLPPYQSTQSQSLTTNSPFNLGQVHTQPQPPCSFPNQQSSSLVKGRTCRMSCPTSQDKARSIIPTYNEEMDWPLQMPLHRLWAARSSLQKNQDVAGQPSPNLPQDSWASRICQCNAKNILESSKSSQPFDTADERDKDFQMRFVLPGRHFRKNAKRSHLGKPRKDLEQDRHEQDHLSCHVSIPEDIMGSESDLTRLRRRDYEDDKPKSPDQKQMKQILKAHLVKKLWQINENRIPVRVSQSWITVSHAFPKSDTHSKSRKLLSLKHQHPGVNTSQELYFLDSLTRHMLEAHIKKCREKHGWDLDYSQGLRINSVAAQTLHHPQCTFPSLLADKSEADMTTNIARSLGDPQKRAGEKMVPLLEKPLFAPSPVYKDIQRTLGATPSRGSSGFSEISRTRQEAKLPTKPHTSGQLGRFQERKTAQVTEKGDTEGRSSSAMARKEPQHESRVPTLPDPCKIQVNKGVQSTRTKETREASEDQKQSAWEVTMGASVKTFSQVIDVSLSFKSQGAGKCPQPMRNSIGHHAGQKGLETQTVNEVEVKMQLDAEKQPQGQGSVVKSRHCIPELLPTTHVVPSLASRATSKSLSSSSISASQGLQAPVSNGKSKQRQEQQPRISQIKGEAKKGENKISPSDKREECRRPKLVDQEERAKGQVASSAHKMIHPAWERTTRDTLGNKSSPIPSKKGQASPEGHNRRNITTFVQGPYPIKKGTGRKDSLPEGRPVSATPWNEGSHVSKMFRERRDTEARTLIRVVGKIMADQLGLPYYGRGSSEINWYKREHKAPPHEHFCHHKSPSYPEQRKTGTGIAFGHQANPQGIGYSLKNKWSRDRANNWVSQPREFVYHSSPIQHRPKETAASGWPIQCPRNCPVQKGVSSAQTHHSSYVFPSGKSFSPEKSPFLQRKPTQSRVSTFFT